MKISRWGCILLCVCLFDLNFTLHGINLGILYEANPFMNYFWVYHGSVAFVSVKLLLSALPIKILEFSGGIIGLSKLVLVYKVTVAMYIFLFLSMFFKNFF